MGCPRKDKPVTNSQKCLSYRKKLNREEYLQEERKRKQLQHSNLKQDPTAYKKFLIQYSINDQSFNLIPFFLL